MLKVPSPDCENEIPVKICYNTAEDVMDANKKSILFYNIFHIEN